jgi:hypothetical protein
MLTCLSAPGFAQSPDDAIKALVAAINAGSLPGTQAAMTASPTITDEFPPFHWAGKTAAADWMNGFATDAKAHGVTDDSVTIGKPLHLTVEGLHGYAVVPMTFAYKQNGKPVTENALFTVSLVKTGEKWLISSWTYALK